LNLGTYLKGKSYGMPAPNAENNTHLGSPEHSSGGPAGRFSACSGWGSSTMMTSTPSSASTTPGVLWRDSSTDGSSEPIKFKHWAPGVYEVFDGPAIDKTCHKQIQYSITRLSYSAPY
jgi:hypothetical protein